MAVDNTTVLILLGRKGAAAAAGVSESWWTLLNVPPDALVDDRRAWLPQTAARQKAALQAKRAERRRV